MCLVPTSRIKRAVEDITVFKLFINDVDGRLLSPIKQHEYKLGTTEKVWWFGGAKGLPVLFARPSVEIHRGLHSFSSIDMAKRSGYFYDDILECVIPKNSLYITGVGGELVSLKLRAVQVVEPLKGNKYIREFYEGK